MTAIQQLERIIIEPKSEANASIIWLHGLGADGHDFEPVAQQLRLPSAMACRFILPHAPVRPVTLNGGMPMRAWFDLTGLDTNALEQADGILQAAQQIDAIIQQEIDTGIPAKRIVLAGFSQGGSLALFSGMQFQPHIGGILALSTYLPRHPHLTARSADAPVIMQAHGTFDPVLPFAMGEATYQLLRDMHYEISWHEYPIDHSVSAEELSDIRAWLIKLLA